MRRLEKCTIWRDKWEFAKRLPASDRAAFLYWVIEYQLDGTLPEDDGSTIYGAFMAMVSSFDKSVAQQENASMKRQKKVTKDTRELANSQPNLSQTLANSQPTANKYKYKNKYKNKREGVLRTPPARANGKPAFSVPSVGEVREYAAEAGLADHAEAFHDHFAANGWRIGGKAPMRDWRAAYRNWCRREIEFSKGGNGNGRRIQTGGRRPDNRIDPGDIAGRSGDGRFDDASKLEDPLAGGAGDDE